jgi:uncharacterized Ntn-hydrolase superfamily protein
MIPPPALAVAIATRALAVGAHCSYVRAGVGAVATQSITNRYFGPAILHLIARGIAPAAAIDSALAAERAGSCGRRTWSIGSDGPPLGPAGTALIPAASGPRPTSR